MKRFWSLTAVSAALMLGLPWLIVTFVRGDGGMALCFLLFFAVDPAWAVAAGCLSGRRPKILWPIPAVTALLFLAGTWLLFSPGEPAFLLYAAIYLLFGYASFGAVWLHQRLRK